MAVTARAASLVLLQLSCLPSDLSMEPLLMTQAGQLLDDLKAAIDGIPAGIMARTWHGPPAINASFKPRADQSLLWRGFLFLVANMDQFWENIRRLSVDGINLFLSSPTSNPH
ncbi:hypothetical protein DFH08DRAFT_818720 [Mycena albidolilacea]|uniref:Uncharacterized protein n=1 Tax=Mycena albidolilacea TaxID=1033008 RepID=A0AAD7EHF1_9AGAR|nr:hypothetical protein DFH08DRAFT_818720 [Mycena albidolilacea]